MSLPGSPLQLGARIGPPLPVSAEGEAGASVVAGHGREHREREEGEECGCMGVTI